MSVLCLTGLKMVQITQEVEKKKKKKNTDIQSAVALSDANKLFCNNDAATTKMMSLDSPQLFAMLYHRKLSNIE